MKGCVASLENKAQVTKLSSCCCFNRERGEDKDSDLLINSFVLDGLAISLQAYKF